MKNIPRQALHLLLDRAKVYPVLTVLGPRQSGKTTLCRMAFADKPYVNLERPDVRDYAQTDPRGFLAQYPDGAVLEEIQNVPELLSWLQVLTDEDGRKGRFVLTGSHQLELNAQITQSLAGRTAVLELLPLSLSELCEAGLTSARANDADTLMLLGGYPKIHAERAPASVILSDYYATYVTRDVRQLIQIRQMRSFEQCLRMLAGRVGQLLNHSSLGNEIGVSSNTVNQWVSVLQASFLVFCLPPWSVNVGKRWVKSPKLYFYDVGLACWLLGIHTTEQLQHHPLRGALFENLVVVEILKALRNQGRRDTLYFLRDSNGLEIDVLLESGEGLRLIEIKASQTATQTLFKSLRKVGTMLAERSQSESGLRLHSQTLIYGGDEAQTRSDLRLLPFAQASRVI